LAPCIAIATNDRELYAPGRGHIKEKTWQEVAPYLLPWHSPLRAKLDILFAFSRATLSPNSLKKAGFLSHKPRRFTRLIVTAHPQLPGYILKLYVDAQGYHQGKCEQQLWIERIQGAELIRAMIGIDNCNHLFKVPKKWIYPLPQRPSPPQGYIRKNFILVEEDMEICAARENEKKWKSRLVTKERLHALYTIISVLGLSDCAKPDNIPFCRDERIAFVDTQLFHQSSISHKKLLPYLRSPMRRYWQKLWTKEV